jgi:hypothetical protein
MSKRFLIIGHARHGKDTTAEIIKEMYGYTFESSSMAAARIFLFDKLKAKYGYQTFEECYADRENRRAEWHDEICDYNLHDKARLAKDILSTSNMYVGMRSNVEVEECLRQHLFDYVIGVYDYRKPLEDKSSFNINIWEKSDILLPNSQGIAELRQRIFKLSPLLIDFSKRSFRKPGANVYDANAYNKLPKEFLG